MGAGTRWGGGWTEWCGGDRQVWEPGKKVGAGARWGHGVVGDQKGAAELVIMMQMGKNWGGLGWKAMVRGLDGGQLGGGQGAR